MPATFAPRASAVSATTLPSAPSAPVTTMTLLFMAELRVKMAGAQYRRIEITCNGAAFCGEMMAQLKIVCAWRAQMTDASRPCDTHTNLVAFKFPLPHLTENLKR